MKNLIRHILLEEVSKVEYQVRDIGGSAYYKRHKGEKWSFTDEIDFFKNSNRNNLVKWVEKKPKKGPKVKQIDVPQKDIDTLEYLKIYYQNLSPNNYSVRVKEGQIIIEVK